MQTIGYANEWKGKTKSAPDATIALRNIACVSLILKFLLSSAVCRQPWW